MAMKTKLVPLSEVFDYASGMNMFEITQTFTNRLDKCELMRYINAMEKVATKEVLNKKDIELFDKIDEITFKHFGMCLKDSQVTKARIKSCKKYGVQFVDRDGLIEHMKLAFGILH